MSLKKAVQKIEKCGALLVFPIDNRKEPYSLWSELYPKSEMRWEWDESGDNRVAELWHLRTELSLCKKVVYSKWYKGRATFFSRLVFSALLRELAFHSSSTRSLSETAQQVLQVLEQESPLSTKVLKRETGLKGKDQEGAYTKALKVLWDRMLIVGFGEVEDGAFPSLAMGATALLFDDLWEEAKTMRAEESQSRLHLLFSEQPLYRKEFQKIKQGLEKSCLESTRKGILRGSDIFLRR
ncbi:MAG: hypothetical protein EB120_03795 [Proteobacteria bacterium]|nr:hypothetical protein [Pseudomonadota bacterium]NDG26283.1 hypothetical protein [Pseudomonadota bacterium]